MRQSTKKGETRGCGYCGKDVYVYPRDLKFKLSFCNRIHQNQHQKEGAFYFLCMICNTKVFTQPAQMKYRNRKTCSLECLAVVKRQEAIERRKTYTKHQLDRLARYSPEATIWRRAVFERDNYTCQWCGVRGSYLEADHIKPWAYFPDLRFELSNGRTLCRLCHDTTKVSAKKLREMYGDCFL